MPLDAAVPALDVSKPVLILGGKENALSLVRSLGKRGISVKVSGQANCWGLYSRYCSEAFRIPFGQVTNNYWRNLLLGSNAAGLYGHIVIPCSDDAIEFIAENRVALSQYYILGEGDRQLQLALLDKRRTIELANEAGVDAPQFWTVDKESDLDNLKGAAKFPLLVKPIHSHKFSRIFGRKLFIIESGFEELAEKVRLALSHGLQIMVVEMIPGPDDLLSSYYTYRTATGKNLFHYTKRILRRYPVNSGNACFHLTEWLPETAELGRKFFDAIDFQGLGNIEFKRDPRDGKLKIIEVNARFTAAQELVARSGAPIDLVVYCHLTGQNIPEFNHYLQCLSFWYPIRDFLSYIDLRRRGSLSFTGWLASVASYKHIFPLFNLRDIGPSFGAMFSVLRRLALGQG
jgi:predicted ATP-grasp superfamily ATP-dependent carboligase